MPTLCAHKRHTRVVITQMCAGAAVRRRRSPVSTWRTPVAIHVSSTFWRTRVQLNGVRFLFDGERLRENQTPGELDMEDGDAIDVQIEQVNASRVQSCSLCGQFTNGKA